MGNLSIIGCKCWPNNYGGFESLIENLFRDENFLSNFEKITIYVESFDIAIASKLSNVEFVKLPVIKAKNPIKFYFMSLFLAKDDDFNLILGLAGGISLPFFRIFNRSTQYIVNLDGIEWKRTKFSASKRILLYLLNIFSIIFSHKIICDSRALHIDNKFVKYKKKSFFIPYSSRFEEIKSSVNFDGIGNDFILAISRFVPENNIEMICDGWNRFKKKYPDNKMRFIFIGDIENYDKDLQATYPNIDFIGPIFDLEKLKLYFDSCSAYIHGHSVGGTNPVLVEAISRNCNIFANDNIYNKDTLQEHGNYFSTSKELEKLLSTHIDYKDKDLLEFYALNYSNNLISRKYIDAIQK